MTISLTLPRMEIKVEYQDASFTLIPLSTEDLDGIVVTPSPEAVGTVLLEIAAYGTSEAIRPATESVIGLEVQVNGEAETLKPVTDNTPMSLSFGLKGIA